MSLLKVSHLNKTILQKSLLHDIGFTVDKAEIVSIIGPNGSGKTTLVRILLGLEKADSGKIFMAPNLSLSYMPQKLHIDSTLPLTVERFMLMNHQRYASIENKKSAIDWQWFEQLINKVEIQSLLQRNVQVLSGGERQRVLLAQAMLIKPQLMVLDEPSQGLDINGQDSLYRLLEWFRDQLNTAILMVSHDLHFVMQATDKVLCLNRHICCEGSPERISQNPHFLQLFGNQYSQLALYHHHHNHHHGLDGSIEK